MKKSVLLYLLILAFHTNYSYAQSINSEKEDNWIIGKWYPAYFYYDDGEGNEVKKEFDLCITESYLEFNVKNKRTFLRLIIQKEISVILIINLCKVNLF